MNEPTIRPATLSDLPYLYEICLKTANAGRDATSLLTDPNMVGQIFAAPYLVYDIACCFVVDVAHVPKGYIVGCCDSNAFANWYESTWQPALQAKYPLNAETPSGELESFLLSCIHEPVDRHTFSLQYPAHLHINLLPVLQGHGLGKKMIERLLDALKDKTVKGIHLGVDAKNESAISFYERFGFQRIDTADGVYYGLDLANRV